MRNTKHTRHVKCNLSAPNADPKDVMCFKKTCVLKKAKTCHASVITVSCRELSHMGWLPLVGSLKFQVSFAEYRLFYRALLQKTPIILRSLLIEAMPYEMFHASLIWNESWCIWYVSWETSHGQPLLHMKWVMSLAHTQHDQQKLHWVIAYELFHECLM